MASPRLTAKGDGGSLAGVMLAGSSSSSRAIPFIHWETRPAESHEPAAFSTTGGVGEGEGGGGGGGGGEGGGGDDGGGGGVGGDGGGLGLGSGEGVEHGETSD